jgi:hypothetical protein
MSLEVIGLVFNGRDKLGDFEWMCHQKEYMNSLFIFNDNEEYHNTNVCGKGNAIMRKYNKYSKFLSKPKSAGIPTGTFRNRGYKKLDERNKKVIDDSIKEIKELIVKYHYDKIYFSCDEVGNLGTKLFVVDMEVVHYITEQIRSLKKL